MVEMNNWLIMDQLIENGEHVCAWGPSSVGKSHLAQMRGGYPLTCTESMQETAIIGHPWPNGAVWEWRDGPATKAFRHGKPLILNELTRCNPEVLDTLLCLCDSRESAKLTLPTGEVLTAAPGYVAVGTCNADPEQILDPALQKRFQFLNLTTPHPQLIARISDELPELGALVENSYKSGQAQIDCREALRFLRYRKLFEPEVAARLCFKNRGRDILAMLPLAKGASA